MANKYYKHQTVKSAQDASLFSDEYTWTILDILRAAGPAGMSAQNVHKQIADDMGRVVSVEIESIMTAVCTVGNYAVWKSRTALLKSYRIEKDCMLCIHSHMSNVSLDESINEILHQCYCRL